ncbi:hypothetical protein CH337_21250 [Rhodoblastus acidophilus]|nr:hypothetical protein CKO16_22100 [Rhodoblastus acidophilus]RAI16459.1 hypothetical protein CH337_21250 [Rhodoblastus acidophilus]
MRQHVLQGGARDRGAVGGAHGGAGGKGPIAALSVFDIDGAVEQHRRAVCRRSQQHRRQFAREIEGFTPQAEHVGSLVDQRAQIGRGHRRRARIHERGEIGVVCGGDCEARHPAKALRVDRGRRRPGGLAAFAAIDCAGLVGLEDGFVDGSLAAVGIGENRCRAQSCAAGVLPIEIGCFQRNRNDSEVGKRLELVGLRDAVVIGVDPDFQLIEDCVGRVDDAVLVDVILTKVGEAGVGERAEKLGGVIDRAVAVLVVSKKTFVAASEPARAFREEIVVDVEMHA